MENDVFGEKLTDDPEFSYPVRQYEPHNPNTLLEHHDFFACECSRPLVQTTIESTTHVSSTSDNSIAYYLSSSVDLFTVIIYFKKIIPGSKPIYSETVFGAGVINPIGFAYEIDMKELEKIRNEDPTFIELGKESIISNIQPIQPTRYKKKVTNKLLNVPSTPANMVF